MLCADYDGHPKVVGHSPTVEHDVGEPLFLIRSGRYN
jgi:hypothetical protein